MELDTIDSWLKGPGQHQQASGRDSTGTTTVGHLQCVKSALEAIVNEEAGHGALAWKTMEWLVAQGAAGTTEALCRLLREELTSHFDRVARRCGPLMEYVCVCVG